MKRPNWSVAFSGSCSGCPVISVLARMAKSFRLVWAKRLPRKAKKKEDPQANQQLAECQPDFRRVARKRPAHVQSNAPAHYTPPPSAQERKVAQPASRAQRLAAGRTPARLAALMRTHLFSKPISLQAGSLRPSGGLFATWAGTPVFIVSTFSRHNVPHADVVGLRQKKDGSNLWNGRLSQANTHTIKQEDLFHVGLHYRLLRKQTKMSSCLCSFACIERLMSSFCS